MIKKKDIERLKFLDKKWDRNMKSNTKAGGNSNDNQERLVLRRKLKTVK